MVGWLDKQNAAVELDAKRLIWAAAICVAFAPLGCAGDATNTGVGSGDVGQSDTRLAPSDAGAADASDAAGAADQLSVCVLQDRGPAGRCAEPSVVDFGSVAAGGDAQRLVRIDNVGQRLVEFSDLNVASAQFELTAVFYGAAGSGDDSLERTEASLPVERQPDESIYVEIVYNAGSTSGSLPADHIEIQASVDGASLFVAVPMVGEVLACEADHGDCDGDPSNGCEANLNADDLNCGACGDACDTESGTGTCANGSCVLDQCTAPFADCNNMDADGCEVDTATDVDHCGGCASPCAPPHATAACQDARCGIGACDEGFADCNDDPDDGCEVNLTNDAANCGTCGDVCETTGSTAVCVDSECTLGVCEVPFQNCDNTSANGCEVNVETDPDNCGACNNHCINDHGSTLCSKSSCAPTCVGQWDSCDSNPDNGCETSLTSAANCGACGQPCDLPNAVESCSTGACELTRCDTGYADCNGDPADGCEVHVANSVQNCGACGNVCANPQGSSICSGGTCVPNCSAGYDSCDGDPSNGCETSLDSSNNCGSCGNTCNLSNASASCTSGSCGISQCNQNYCDLNGNAGDGCEHSLDQYAYCSSNAGSVGSVSGDEDNDTRSASNSGNKWYKVRVTEDDGSVFSEEDLAVRIDLVPPAGADYDLEAHCAGCSGTSRSSANAGDNSETIRFKWDDKQPFGGSDDSHTVYIHVEPHDVRTCGDWTLQVEGNPSNEGSETGCSN